MIRFPLRLVVVFLALFLGLMITACESDYSRSGGDADVQKTRREELRREADINVTLFKETDRTVDRFFKSAYGYAVFPSIGKGGAGIGGAYGKGVVYEKGRVVGYATVSQGTIGLQLGGQAYREIVFFQTKAGLDRFKSGTYEFAAQASAVAANEGAAANADYAEGIAIFTLARGGLMGEAVVGGQKFSFETR